MKKLIPTILLLSALGAQAAAAQALISNGSQTGVVQAPASQAPMAQGPATFGSADTQQSTPIQPQMPTTTNMPGSPPAIAAPVRGASPGVPVLNAPTAQASPSPSP
jgi:hypothetical protein